MTSFGKRNRASNCSEHVAWSNAHCKYKWINLYIFKSIFSVLAVSKQNNFLHFLPRREFTDQIRLSADTKGTTREIGAPRIRQLAPSFGNFTFYKRLQSPWTTEQKINQHIQLNKDGRHTLKGKSWQCATCISRFTNANCQKNRQE